MIWFLIDSSSLGGAERHIAVLAQSLTRRGIAADIVLYANHGRNPWIEQLEAINASVRVLDGSFTGLVRSLRLKRPGLLHTHGYKAGVLGRLAARLVGTPVVSTFHSGERFGFPVNAYHWLDDWTSFLGERIVVSEMIKRRVPFPSAHIPSFIMTSSAAPSGTLPRRVGFVGRLSAEKGPDLFCTLARRSPSGVEWHVYGDGPMRARLEGEYGDTVRFHGVVTDLEPVWSTLGLLVMPSRFEGLPLAALEALTAGIPVLASRVGGLPSVVVDGQTGWLFESGNLDAARSCLDDWQALDSAQQAIMRRSCWTRVRSNFSELKWLPEVLTVYKQAGYSPPIDFGMVT
jgi:glycosyltransferase involved in cell wall biosynthesis